MVLYRHVFIGIRSVDLWKNGKIQVVAWIFWWLELNLSLF